MVIQVNDEGKGNGIWKGAKGTEYGAERNTKERENLFIELQDKLVVTIQALEDTEKLIDMASDVLRISQPPMIGKLSVRWWILGKVNRFIEPVLVRWMMQANKVMTPVRAIRFAAKNGGRFEMNYKETQICLDILKECLGKRAELKKSLDTCRRAMQHIYNFALFEHDCNLELHDIRYKVAKRLFDAGYDVEERFLKVDDDGI